MRSRTAVRPIASTRACAAALTKRRAGSAAALDKALLLQLLDEAAQLRPRLLAGHLEALDQCVPDLAQRPRAVEEIEDGSARAHEREDRPHLAHAAADRHQEVLAGDLAHDDGVSARVDGLFRLDLVHERQEHPAG